MEEIESYEHYNPLSAVLAGKDDAAKKEVYRRVSALPDEVSDVLMDEATAEKIASWEQVGMFPATHAVAVSKIVGLVLLGTIRQEQVGGLLEKLNLDAASVQQIALAIGSITDPAIAFLGGYREQGVPLTEVPPLQVTAPLNPEPQGRNVRPSVEQGSTEASRPNVINLRKPNEN